MGSSCSVASAPVGGPEQEETPARDCTLIPSRTRVMAHAIPHIVVSQIVRPEVAAFLPADQERWCAAACCVKAVTVCSRGCIASCDTVAVLEYAAQFPRVKSVSLLDCQISQKAACVLRSNFPNLTALDLSRSRITDAILSELPLLKNLRSLLLQLLPARPIRQELHGHVVRVDTSRSEKSEPDTSSYLYTMHASSIAAFALMPSLEVLDLRGWSLDDDALTALTNLRFLVELSIDMQDFTEYYGYTPGLPDFSALEFLQTVRVRCDGKTEVFYFAGNDR